MRNKTVDVVDHDYAIVEEVRPVIGTPLTKMTLESSPSLEVVTVRVG